MKKNQTKEKKPIKVLDKGMGKKDKGGSGCCHPWVFPIARATE